MPSPPQLEYWLVAGRIAPASKDWIKTHFAKKGWELRGPDWIADHLNTMSAEAYEDDTTTMVAKLIQPLLRGT